MYNENINLTSQDILDKDFPIDTRGYRPQEVDKYLDLIIKDYTEYNNIIKKLIKENKLLEDEISKLRQEVRRYKETEDIVESSTTRITNLDILKRLSSLEKTVYGKNSDIS